jgi:hypothetical protein
MSGKRLELLRRDGLRPALELRPEGGEFLGLIGGHPHMSAHDQLAGEDLSLDRRDVAARFLASGLRLERQEDEVRRKQGGPQLPHDGPQGLRAAFDRVVPDRRLDGVGREPQVPAQDRDLARVLDESHRVALDLAEHVLRDDPHLPVDGLPGLQQGRRDRVAERGVLERRDLGGRQAESLAAIAVDLRRETGLLFGRLGRPGSA